MLLNFNLAPGTPKGQESLAVASLMAEAMICNRSSRDPGALIYLAIGTYAGDKQICDRPLRCETGRDWIPSNWVIARPFVTRP